jgi:hypothetical protein
LSLLNELKRRKVFKVGIAYIFIAWVVAQILELLFDSFGTPDWAIKSVLVLLATGFIFALFFTWVYEITPDGIKSQQEVDRSQSITPELIKTIRNNKTAARQLNSMMYKSHSKDLADLDLVESILESSTQNNPVNGITGILVVTETHFLQVLEGEFEALNATFEKICLDKRHDKVQLISFTEINERKFANWAMHGIGLFDLNQELKSRLCMEFGEDQGVLRLPTTARETLSLLDILLSEKTLGKDAESKESE